MVTGETPKRWAGVLSRTCASRHRHPGPEGQRPHSPGLRPGWTGDEGGGGHQQPSMQPPSWALPEADVHGPPSWPVCPHPAQPHAAAATHMCATLMTPEGCGVEGLGPSSPEEGGGGRGPSGGVTGLLEGAEQPPPIGTAGTRGSTRHVWREGGGGSGRRKQGWDGTLAMGAWGGGTHCVFCMLFSVPFHPLPELSVHGLRGNQGRWPIRQVASWAEACPVPRAQPPASCLPLGQMHELALWSAHLSTTL